MSANWMGLNLLAVTAGMLLFVSAAAEESLNEINKRALKLQDEGRYEEAVTLGKQVVERAAKQYGKKGIDYAGCLYNLAEAYSELKQYDAARPLYLEACQLARDAGALNDKRYESILRGLAEFYLTTNDYANAERTYKDAAEADKRLFGENSHEYGQTMSWLGWMYRAQGRYKDAIECSVTAAEIYQRVLGEKDDRYFNILDCLAGSYKMDVQYDKAEAGYRRLLDLQVKAFGEDHEKCRKTREALAALLEKTRQETQAGQQQQEQKPVEPEQADADAQLGASLAELHKRVKALSFYDEKYAEALPLAQQYVNAARKEAGEESAAYATSLTCLGEIYEKLHDYASAEPFYQEALRIRKRVLDENDPDYLRSIKDLGYLYWTMKRYDRAEPLYQEALQLTGKRFGEHSAEYADRLQSLVLVYRKIGKFVEARRLTVQQERIRRELLLKEDEQELAETKTKCGDKSAEYGGELAFRAMLHCASEDYEEAERMYTEALRILLTAVGTRNMDYAVTLENFGDVYYKMGEYPRAQSLYSQAVEIQVGLGSSEKDMRLTFLKLAETYQSMGEYAKAEQFYNRTIRLMQNITYRDGHGLERKDSFYGVALHELGKLYHYYINDSAKAEPLYLRAIEAQKAEWGESNADFRDLAMLYHDMGEYAKAEPLYLASLEHRRDWMGEWNATILQRYAELLVQTARAPQGLKYYEESLSEYESVRGGLATETERRAFQAKSMDDVYAATAVIYKCTGNTLKCFETIERSRAKALMELFETRRVRGERVGDTKELDAVEEELKRLKSLAGRMASAPSGQKTRSVSDIMQESAELCQARLKLIQEKTQWDPELGNLMTVKPSTLTEIQQLLDPGVALVEYFHPGEVEFQDGKVNELWAFVLATDQATITSVPVAKADLRKAAQDYASAVADPGSDPAEQAALSAKLYGWLVAPIARDLAAYETVVIVPWDVLYYVPFGALAPEKGEPLGAQKRVVLAPAAGVYRYLKAKRASNHGKLLALGNPKTELIPLRGAQDEAKAVKKAFGESRVLLGPEATETEVKKGRGGADVVHFACHGMLNTSHPELSYLALTPDAENDGHLEMHEVFGLDWKGVSLVTLSACSTGKGKLGAGNDLVGLMRGFMFAGAPSVLATLWDVDDESTRVFMEEFYRNYTSGKTKPESFQSAQAKVRNDPKWSHPYYWAPFVLWGDWK